MLLGLIGSALTMIAFGFARTYGEALLTRFVCGAVNGNIAINKVYMGETSTAANQARGFGVLFEIRGRVLRQSIAGEFQRDVFVAN